MCNSCSITLPTDQFVERLVGILNSGGLGLMISIGHRTGLFDTMNKLAPATSKTIAGAACLNERYVREWLGALVTGQIVRYNPADDTYQLPEEHAAVLTRSACPNNMASVMQWISVLGSVEDKIVECFKNGGGLQYEDYGRFHPVMAEESNQTTVEGFDEFILPLMPNVVAKLNEGIEVLDIGCGQGKALIFLAEFFPQSTFFGYDLCDSAIVAAKAAARERNLANVFFEKRDVSKLTDKRRFGLITAFDAIHDQARPDAVLKCIADALASDGTFLMQDIKASSKLENNSENPIAPFIFTISCMHCMSVSLGQGGMGLGAAWGREKAVAMLGDAGFPTVDVHELPHDIINYYYVAQVA